MPFRTVSAGGTSWRVQPSGFITANSRDEFALIFTCGGGEGSDRESRVVRYSPRGAKSREQSFAELTDDELRALLAQSQPGATSPEVFYAQ